MDLDAYNQESFCIKHTRERIKANAYTLTLSTGASTKDVLILRYGTAESNRPIIPVQGERVHGERGMGSKERRHGRGGMGRKRRNGKGRSGWKGVKGIKKERNGKERDGKQRGRQEEKERDGKRRWKGKLDKKERGMAWIKMEGKDGEG